MRSNEPRQFVVAAGRRNENLLRNPRRYRTIATLGVVRYSGNRTPSVEQYRRRQPTAETRNRIGTGAGTGF